MVPATTVDMKAEPMEVVEVTKIESKPRTEKSVMWIEKYRPKSLDDLISHTHIVATLTRLIENKRLPHLLFYGPPGTGKTSTIMACARRMYGEAYKSMVLELNASDDRGISVVREQIKGFVSTKRLWSGGAIKLVVLDEADAMSSAAQMALRRVLEKYVANARFCIICNYVNKIIPALQSRCTKFRFGPLPPDAARDRLKFISDAEGVKLANGALEALLALSEGDMRRALNVLQSAHMAAPNDTALSVTNLYATAGTPHPSDIDALWKVLRTSGFETAAKHTQDLRTGKGLALTDLVQALAPHVVSDVDLHPKAKSFLFSQLADIEHRLSVGASEHINSAALVGVFTCANAIAIDATASA